MKNTKFDEGEKVRAAFERTMTALFRVPKDTVKKPEKPVRKKKEASKD